MKALPVTPSFESITQLIQSEFQAVNEQIQHALQSSVNTIHHIGQHIINSGGKRIRPLVTLLAAKLCHAPQAATITTAAIIEFIHTATLLHDDVVDEATLRRGRPTAHCLWDNPSAVLVGDFLYSRAFQMMISLNNMTSMQILAQATNQVAEGEVLQLTHRFQPELTENQYRQVIALKTAKLFEAAAQLGAAIHTQPIATFHALGIYGHHLGMAFQLVDDVLDYQAESPAWGKNVGNDLAEGKMTLPLIFALQNTGAQERAFIRQAIQEGRRTDLARIQAAIVSTGAIDYTMEKAKQEANHAIDALALFPPSPYREAMANLAEFAVSRSA